MLGWTGRIGTVHLNSNIDTGMLHRAFSVFLFDSSNRLLIQVSNIMVDEVGPGVCACTRLRSAIPVEANPSQHLLTVHCICIRQERWGGYRFARQVVRKIILVYLLLFTFGMCVCFASVNMHGGSTGKKRASEKILYPDYWANTCCRYSRGST